jgi:hypothetical protein
LVAQLLLDKQMLQDIAKKSGDADSAAVGRGRPQGAVWHLAAQDLSCPGAISLDAAVLPNFPNERGATDSSDQPMGATEAALRIPPDS